MNTQTNNRPGLEYLALAITAAFLAFCLGYGTAVQKQVEARIAEPAKTVSQPQVDRNLDKADQADTVYFVCEWSRQQIDGPSERLCGQLQDSYQMEYICQERSASPANQCHVESHDGDTPESKDV